MKKESIAKQERMKNLIEGVKNMNLDIIQDEDSFFSDQKF